MSADHDSVTAGHPPPPARAMGTRRFPWAVIAITIGLVLAGCRQDRESHEASLPFEACFSDGPILTYTLPPELSVLEAEPLEMMDALQPPPLKPDRRILFAVAEIDGLLTGADPGEVHAEATAEGWQIRYDGVHVGDLAAAPDFDEVLEFLEAWTLERAGQEQFQLPGSIDPAGLDSTRADVAAFHSIPVARGLARLDALWRESGGDAALLAPAVRGLTYLSMQTMNRLDNADPLVAGALAALALARALGDENLSTEEALLASDMGYAVHAHRLVESLPADDPVRLAMTSREEELRELAESSGSDPLTRFLYARYVAGDGAEEWLSWVAEYARPHEMSLSALQSGFSVGRFELTRTLAELYPYVALLELWEATGEPPLEGAASFDGRSWESLIEAIEAIRKETGATAADLVRQFEMALATLPERYPGPFLDPPAYRAFFAGNFYSGLHAGATFRIGSLASAPAAADFASELEGSPGPIGNQFQRWLAHLAASEAGRTDTTGLMADLGELDCLGESPLLRTFNHLDDRLATDDVRRFEAVRRTARHLDARPDHQHSYASIVRKGYDLGTSETYYRNVVRLAAPQQRFTEVWFARFDGDTARLRAMIADDELSMAVRQEALEYFIDDRLGDDDAIRESAEFLIAADPDRWALRGTYIDYLVDIGAHEDGIPVVEDWLGRHTEEDGFPYIFARTALAGLNYRSGRYGRAMRLISPVVGSGQAGALGRAALILHQLGRVDEARTMVLDAVERYPNTDWLRARAAEILWRQGRYDDVAEVLNEQGHRVSDWAWRHEVAESFLEVFGDRPPEEGAEAFAALIEGGIPSWVSEGLPVGLSRADRPDLAFALGSQLEAQGTIGGLRHPINAYQYLKAWKGERVALDWIRPRIPSRVLSDASQVMFQEDAGELQWELIPDPASTAFPPGLWLMRAAAFVRAGDTDPARRQALMAYYGAPSNNDYVAMGKYLMGLESEESLLARAQTAERRCEIAFYIGLQAEGERRYRDAAAWYRLVLETGQTKEYEYGYALDALNAWRNSLRSLDLLEAE